MKLLSWNVEHFDGTSGGVRTGRLNRVIDIIKDADPDIFAIIEVEGKHVFGALVKKFPGYTFSITEGDQSQEILIAVRGGVTAFMTQRNEFKRSNPYLRPGALLTVTNGAGKLLPILFTHLKSSPSPEGFGLRDAMFEKVRHLKRALDKAAGGNAEMILVGDLNTMGLNLTYHKNDLSGPEEITRVERVLKSANLFNQEKTHPFTWSNGSKSKYEPAALDHVFATPGLKFKDQGGGATVKVGGWALKPTVKTQDTWISKNSDHTPLIFEIEGFL